MMAKSREVDGEKLTRNTKQHKDLPIGTLVAIQNQTGRYPTKWDKTGVVVEVRPHEQIVVKVDRSRRLTLRNRRFVRELDPRMTSLEDQHLMTSSSTHSKTNEDETYSCCQGSRTMDTDASVNDHFTLDPFPRACAATAFSAVAVTDWIQDSSTGQPTST